MGPQANLVSLARMFVGTTETGNNSGPLVEMFQKAVDGIARQESWCMSFVQWCCDQVDEECGTKHILYPSENCMSVWGMTPQPARLQKPEPGAVVIFQHWKMIRGKKGNIMEIPLSSGHCGIVINVVNSEVVETVEANTSNSGLQEIVREGDGIFLKRRVLEADVGSMRFVGLLTPWP